MTCENVISKNPTRSSLRYGGMEVWNYSIVNSKNAKKKTWPIYSQSNLRNRTSMTSKSASAVPLWITHIINLILNIRPVTTQEMWNPSPIIHTPSDFHSWTKRSAYKSKKCGRVAPTRGVFCLAPRLHSRNSVWKARLIFFFLFAGRRLARFFFFFSLHRNEVGDGLPFWGGGDLLWLARIRKVLLRGLCNRVGREREKAKMAVRWHGLRILV